MEYICFFILAHRRNEVRVTDEVSQQLQILSSVDSTADRNICNMSYIAVHRSYLMQYISVLTEG